MHSSTGAAGTVATWGLGTDALGSSPSPATHGVYSDLISLAAPGDPGFSRYLRPCTGGYRGFWPSVLQLNRKEAAGQVGKSAVNDQDVLSLLANWHRHGVTCGVVTDGPNPGWCRSGKTVPGDSTGDPGSEPDRLGRFAARRPGRRLAGGDRTEPMIRHAMGCAAANAVVWDAGAVDPEQARRFAGGSRPRADRAGGVSSTSGLEALDLLRLPL